MALDFTDDIMALYDAHVGNDANYESPGNYDLSADLAGSLGVASVTVDTGGTYTTVPTFTAATGVATFLTRMSLRSASAIAAAGTGYGIGDVLSLVGGTKTTTATVTVATEKLVSATIAAGGTGYGVSQTFTVTVAGGTQSQTAQLSVTCDAGGIVTTINSVSQAGSYSVLPTLAANAVTGDNGVAHGTGLTLNLVFGVLTYTVSQAGVYTALPTNPIAVTGGTGTGFTLTGSWQVVSVGVVEPGEYETVAPVLNVSAGSGAATAVLASPSVSHVATKKTFMMVELIRSMIDEATTSSELRDVNIVMRKMLAAMKFGSRTVDGSSLADNALDAAMRYIAKNPKHNATSL